ncbi:hypothetical protein ACFL2R_00070 [Patescibacteria group bacterium]
MNDEVSILDAVLRSEGHHQGIVNEVTQRIRGLEVKVAELYMIKNHSLTAAAEMEGGMDDVRRLFDEAETALNAVRKRLNV